MSPQTQVRYDFLLIFNGLWVKRSIQRTDVKRGDAIVSALLSLNVYGAIMAILLFDATELESF